MKNWFVIISLTIISCPRHTCAQPLGSLVEEVAEENTARNRAPEDVVVRPAQGSAATIEGVNTQKFLEGLGPRKRPSINTERPAELTIPSPTASPASSTPSSPIHSASPSSQREQSVVRPDIAGGISPRGPDTEASLTGGLVSQSPRSPISSRDQSLPEQIKQQKREIQQAEITVTMPGSKVGGVASKLKLKSGTTLGQRQSAMEVVKTPGAAKVPPAPELPTVQHLEKRPVGKDISALHGTPEHNLSNRPRSNTPVMTQFIEKITPKSIKTRQIARENTKNLAATERELNRRRGYNPKQYGLSH